MTGIIGRSGAGKSTLLRLINRMIEPTEGVIRADGVDITALRGQALRRWRARTAMIFQQFNLVPRLDVLTNVLCGRLHDVGGARMLLKLFTETEQVAAINALDRMGLVEFAMNRADALSGGQQQRVAIARALMQKPDIILADVNARDAITVLCNLHTLDTARAYCSRIIGMADGRVVFDGAPEQLTDPVLRHIYGEHGDDVVDERLTSTSLPAAATLATART